MEERLKTEEFTENLQRTLKPLELHTVQLPLPQLGRDSTATLEIQDTDTPGVAEGGMPFIKHN